MLIPLKTDDIYKVRLYLEASENDPGEKEMK
jgi:hypothetical protein